ncbi:MAG: DUF4921 family protein [Planctomycetaceae bacterium]|nr:DUF4921 family protein [Planctomycetaceae bacterium]
MPDLRRDAVLDRWVIIAEERSGRPQEFVDRPDVRRAGACPFCEGSEAATPGELSTSLRTPGSLPNGPGWQVRVIPNRYPAVVPLFDRPEASGGKGSVDAANPPQWPFLSRPAAGVHDVVIESPAHLASAAELSAEQTTAVLSVYRARLRELRAQSQLRYVQIFKNVGEPAGASIEHLHSQLIGLRAIPTLLAEEFRGARRLFDERRRCPYCELLGLELAAGERIVAATADFALICPYASRFPYEMCLLPRRHAADFDTASDAELVDAGKLLRRGLASLERLCDFAGIGRAAYNWVLHIAPFDSFGAPHYHWHVEIMPRIVKAAGFEWGTGVHINPVSPETAARSLRALFAAAAEKAN